MMSERQITPEEAGIYRMQAMLEQLLRINCEILAHMANKDFTEIYDRVWQQVNSSTKELITLHSRLGGGDGEPSVN
jgi:hypothetical protein